MNKKRIIVSIVFVLLIILWVIVIYKFSNMSSNSSNSKSRDIITIFIEDTLGLTNKYGITSSNPSEEKLERASILLNRPLRKVMHMSVFFVLSFLIVFFVNYLFKNDKYLLSSLIALVLTFILAFVDEYHQTFVDGRTANFQDVLIDEIGALLGVLFYGTYYLMYRIGYKRGINGDLS